MFEPEMLFHDQWVLVVNGFVYYSELDVMHNIICSLILFTRSRTRFVMYSIMVYVRIEDRRRVGVRDDN